MWWITVAALFLTDLRVAVCFNVDPAAWKTLENPAEGFGHQVVQRRSSLLVSAPLAQHSQTERGQIFRCTDVCENLPLQGAPDFAVNISLGLSMTTDLGSENALACGPTIPKDCKSITMYNGMCVQLTPSNQYGPPITSAPKECQAQADIAFLLDGSGSVSGIDFQTMKSFVKRMVRPFLQQDTQFSISQFSHIPQIHYHFDNFFTSGNWERNIDGIAQIGSTTYTATAIQFVVDNVFTKQRGARDNVRRVLIVITDGASHDRNQLPNSARLAERKRIVRFAIGVGNAFKDPNAMGELRTIASFPSNNHVFQVDNFDALEKIRENLKEKIFSIEGSQSSGESLKMEMSQEGFTAAYTPQGLQLSVVGANQWRGGFVRYNTQFQKGTSYEPQTMQPDSYLGYSMAVATTRQGTLTIVGAPRYEHRGIAMAVTSGNIEKKIDPSPWQFQTGEYFGAVVCAVNMDSDKYTDLVLISAPMFTEADREGRVYVCKINRLEVECNFEAPSVLRGEASEEGRFGASVAALGDLNQDGLTDVAVGAPLENNGEGSIYIFQGLGRDGISSTYSQRIAASAVQSGLKFFGMSISPSSFDQSNDELTDLAVGSRGKVVILRTRPIVMVEATVSFNPHQIPTQNPDCTQPLPSMATICFTMTKHSVVNSVRAIINYTLTLDATRKVPNNRAYVTEKQREVTASIPITLGRTCVPENFFIEACPEDALNELKNELRFTFEGIPSNVNLRPSLAQQAQTTSFHPIGFEINCGVDQNCVDNLKVDFNFSSSSEIHVGIDELLNVTVSLENSGENSYNSHVILTYPVGLSFRKFSGLKGRIECSSIDSVNSLQKGQTDCTVDRPIFKSNAKAVFIVSYGIVANSQLDRRILITANATSGNQGHSPLNHLYEKKYIDVKYSIFMTFGSILRYSNFTYGKNDLQKRVEQSVKVTNHIRALNFTVVIKVPVKLGEKNIWANMGSVQIPDCDTDSDEEPSVKDFVEQIKKTKVVNCSVARCRVFRCTKFIARQDSKTYDIVANLSSEWIQQIGLESAKFLLTSTASLDYDRNQYIFANKNPPVHKIEMEVEVYTEPDFTIEIIGGSLGGLALLALLTAGLYKAGFFKSKYKNMTSDNAEADGAALAPE